MRIGDMLASSVVSVYTCSLAVSDSGPPAEGQEPAVGLLGQQAGDLYLRVWHSLAWVQGAEAQYLHE